MKPYQANRVAALTHELNLLSWHASVARLAGRFLREPPFSFEDDSRAARIHRVGRIAGLHFLKLEPGEPLPHLGPVVEGKNKPAFCEVIEIFDNSMAPEFPAGSAGLVDLRRTKRANGRVFVLEAAGLTVGRTVKTPEGWIVAADNREFQSARWSTDVKIVGQVVWTSHMVGVGKLERRTSG